MKGYGIVKIFIQQDPKLMALIKISNLQKQMGDNWILENIIFKRDIASLLKYHQQVEQQNLITLSDVKKLYSTPTSQVKGKKLYDRISQLQNNQINTSALWGCILSEFKGSVFLSYLLKQLETLMLVALSFFISQIFTSFQQNEKWKCYAYAGGAGTVWLLQAIFNQSSWRQVQQTSLKIKGSLTYAIYLKILSMSTFDMKGNQSGQIINSIIQFHDIFENQSSFILIIFAAPIAIVGLTALLVKQIGWMAVPGVALSILFQFIHSRFGKINGELYSDIAKLKDQRMQILTKVISAFRYIKMQVWETFFATKISKVRQSEMNGLIKYGAGKSFQISLSEGVSTASMLLIVGVTASTNNSLTSKTIIQVVLNILIIKLLIIHASYGITCYYQINSLMERVASIFSKQSKEIKSNQNQKDQEKQIPKQMKNSRGKQIIILNNIECSYNQNISSQYIFKEVNLSIKKGQFIGIFGKVGQGKSALLNLLAKQIPFVNGKLDIKQQLSFHQSDSALFTGTIAQNILFGKKMDQQLYEKAINYSCLWSDISLMPLGDKTLVQEGAINFSGGQRTRICLARAIYANKPILLLDDPLSSLDTRVIQKIMGNLIQLNKNEGKTIILATHQVHCIIKCDRCIEVGNKHLKILSHQQFTKVKQSFSIQQQLSKPYKRQQRKESQNKSKKLIKKFSIIQQQFNVIKYFFDSLKIKQLPKKKEEKQFPVPKSGLIVSFIRYTFKSKWNYLVLPLTIFFYIISQGLYAVVIIYLNQFDQIQAGTNSAFHSEKAFWTALGIMSAFIFIFQVIRQFLLNLTLQLANKALHQEALDHIFKSSVLQLDKLGSKGILDKFSTDLGVLDVGIFDNLSRQFIIGFIFIIQIITIIIFNPIVLAFLVALTVPLYFWYSYSTNVISVLRFLDLKNKGPVIASFSETINGLTQIKNMNAQQYMCSKFQTVLNHSILLGSNFCKIFRSYTAYINYYTTTMIVGSLFAMIAMNDSNSYSNFTFAAVFLIQINVCNVNMISRATKINSTLKSADRVMNLTNLKTEQQFQKQQSSENKMVSEVKLHQNQYGEELTEKIESSINLRHVSLKYEQGDNFALKNISILIQPGKKIALIGRTGSGKSSIIQVLYRLVEIESDSIYFIEGQNALMMNIQTLRKKFTCIPQTPFLFSDSLRRNIDPFQRFQDDQIKEALKKVCIYEYVQQLENGLNTLLVEGQMRLSAGQKQLICLARAILQKKKFLILDEATANIDHKTDQIIQKVLRKEFVGKTIISVAHRLQTILDFDKIIVLSKGEIVEAGTAHQLWRKKGEFYQMVEESGNQKFQMMRFLDKPLQY